MGEVEWEQSSRRSPSRNLLGADRRSQIRNRSNGFVLPVGPVQKVVVETSSASERSNSDPAFGELVTRLAAGDESAFA